MDNAEKRIKVGGTVLCEIFTLLTVIMLFRGGEADRLMLALGTLFLVLLPMAFEKIIPCRFSLPLYLFALIYAIGPMLGHSWKLYYTVPVWDKLLHISGGVMFSILGAFFFDLLAKDSKLPVVKLLFALFFSITVAAVWEFCEFGADRLLGTDMQDDTVIHSLTSYLLGNRLGVTGSIGNVQSVIVNGTALPGYIDIGLIDTMLDMLLETMGAIVTCALIGWDRGRHPCIRVMRSEETKRVTKG